MAKPQPQIAVRPNLRWASLKNRLDVRQAVVCVATWPISVQPSMLFVLIPSHQRKRVRSPCLSFTSQGGILVSVQDLTNAIISGINAGGEQFLEGTMAAVLSIVWL